MRAIQLIATGNPLETLKLVDIPEPEAPEKGETIIRMEYSPINPSDLMMAKGIYFVQPALPSVIGGDGVGMVESIGPGVENVRVGDRVSLPYGIYTWSELVKAPSEGLVVLDPDLDVKQAAMIAINPPTAILLLSEFVQLKKGDWIVLNAGNSSVANTIIAVAKSRGLKTLAIVRRKDVVDIAINAGADAVLVESATVAEEAKAVTANANITLGLDAVGGESSAALARILGEESHLVSYAILSGQPMVVSQVDLIYKRMKIHGFWMHLPQYLPKLADTKNESARLIASKTLNVPIAAAYPLSAISEAVAHTIKGEKVLLDFRK